MDVYTIPGDIYTATNSSATELEATAADIAALIDQLDRYRLLAAADEEPDDS